MLASSGMWERKKSWILRRFRSNYPKIADQTYPSFFTAKMTRRCYAFTRVMKPCYGYGDEETGLCHLHTTYYDDMSFIDKIIEADTFVHFVNGSWVVRMLKASNKSSQELSAKLVSLYNAPNLENTRYIYERGLNVGLIEPFDAPTLWKDLMKINLYILTGMPTWTLYSSFERRVFPYIKCPDSVTLFKNLVDLIEHAHAIHLETWKEYFNILLPHIMNLDLALIDKETLIIADTPLKQFIMAHLETLKHKDLKEWTTKMGPLKSELVAAALHPDRIGPFIKKYGPSVTGLF